MDSVDSGVGLGAELHLVMTRAGDCALRVANASTTYIR